MLKLSGAPKQRVSLDLNSKVIEAAQQLDMDLSAVVDELLTQEVLRVHWAKWQRENQAAIDEYNERIAREGLPLAKYGPLVRKIRKRNPQD